MVWQWGLTSLGSPTQGGTGVSSLGNKWEGWAKIPRVTNETIHPGVRGPLLQGEEGSL